MRGTPVHVQPSQFPRKRLSRELWSSVSSTNKYWGLEAQSSLSPLEWTKLTFHNEIRDTQFLFPEKQALAPTKKSLIILHSALSFNLPLELHASEYESGHAIEFTSVIGIPNQGEISGPECMGVLRGCDDGEDWDDHANGVMIKTKKSLEL